MLLDGLERNNKLSNIDRTYLIVYLMNIGLPLKETEKLLRYYYSKNGTRRLGRSVKTNCFIDFQVIQHCRLTNTLFYYYHYKNKITSTNWGTVALLVL